MTQTSPLLFSEPRLMAILGGDRRERDKKRYSPPGLSRHSPEHIADRIMHKIAKVDKDGCWLWGGHLSNKGYGQMTVGGKKQPVHRVVWRASRGKLIPSGMYVCHSCDKPACANPGHLFLATPAENMRDMVRKGRNPPPPAPRYGAENPHAKLDAGKVSQARRLVAMGRTQASVADDLGVTQSCISRVIRRITWVATEDKV